MKQEVACRKKSPIPIGIKIDRRKGKMSIHCGERKIKFSSEDER